MVRISATLMHCGEQYVIEVEERNGQVAAEELKVAIEKLFPDKVKKEPTSKIA